MHSPSSQPPPGPVLGLPGMARRLGGMVVVAGLLASSGNAEAQLRYLGTVDVSERYISDVNAGQVMVTEVDQGGTTVSEVRSVEPRWDFATVLEPSMRLYYNWARNLVYLRYRFQFLVHARTMDEERGINLYEYGNQLHLGYNHLFTYNTELSVSDHFSQGTQNVTVPPFVSGGGTHYGFQTQGLQYFSNGLQVALGHRINERWAVAPRLGFDLFFPYDRYVDENQQLVPPPRTLGLSASSTLTRVFSVGTAGMALDYAYLHEVRDRDLSGRTATGGVYYPFRATFPETLDSMVVALVLSWRQPLSPSWRYSLEGGADLRIREQYEVPCDHGSPPVCHDPVNLGYSTPEPGPVVGGTLHYTWRNTLSVDLGYTFRTQRLMENAVVTVAQTHSLGLDAYVTLRDWRFELIGVGRYLLYDTRISGESTSEEDGTLMARAGANMAYYLRPGLSVDLAYDLEYVHGGFLSVRSGTQPRSPRDLVAPPYHRHTVTLGLSLAWPPPPAQDRRLTRRESEYEPVFVRMGGAGAADPRGRPSSIDGQPDSVERPRGDVLDPNTARTPGGEAGQDPDITPNGDLPGPPR